MISSHQSDHQTVQGDTATLYLSINTASTLYPFLKSDSSPYSLLAWYAASLPKPSVWTSKPASCRSRMHGRLPVMLYGLQSPHTSVNASTKAANPALAWAAIAYYVAFSFSSCCKYAHGMTVLTVQITHCLKLQPNKSVQAQRLLSLYQQCALDGGAEHEVASS